MRGDLTPPTTWRDRIRRKEPQIVLWLCAIAVLLVILEKLILL